VFDLENDPYETENLADNTELRKRLQKQFLAAGQRTGFDPTGPMPKPPGRP